MISTDPLVWFGAILTLCVLSFLNKETRLYRFAEYTYISVAVGHAFVLGMNSLISQTLEPIMSGGVDVLIMFLFSLLIITQPFKSVRWIARWPNSLSIGVGTGIAMYGAMGSDIIRLVQGVIRDGFISEPGATLTGYFSIIGTTAVLVYFFFTIKREALGGAVGHVATLGRYFMMIAFGAVFANIILSRSTLFFGRMIFILSEWLGIV